MTTFAVKFLGCKVSQADAMLARAKLIEAGHEEVPERDAELHVINTCAVTGEAEAKSRQSVRRSAREGAVSGARGVRGGASARRCVVVTGCAANLDASQFDEIGPSVTALAGSAGDVAGEVVRAVGPGCADLGRRAALRAVPAHDRTRGFVKVQDGCDGRCAYCVIPKVRGGARSRRSSAVLEEVRRRVAQGQPEMVMTGISVGSYRDPERGLELGGLMRAVAGVDGVERVRLSSVEVVHVTDSLIDALAGEARICPHLHIPVQSGDDRVLSAMGREYDSGRYLRAIDHLRRRVPGVNITTDVMVGFPAEDGQAFERTLNLVGKAGITGVHTFSFSPRPGTSAERHGDPVPPEEKKRRSREMRNLSGVLGHRHRVAKLGAVEEVLVDKVARQRVSGYSRDYTRYHLPPASAEAGQLVSARAEDVYPDGVLASVGATLSR